LILPPGSLKLLRSRQLRKEETMGRQRELFEAQERRWTETLWKSLQEETREEVVALLGQMGKAKLLAARQASIRKKKGGVTHDA
jgi:hypothetical protein